MSEWSLLDREWLAAPLPLPYDPYQYVEYDAYYQEKQPQPLPMAQYVSPQAQPYLSPPSPTLTLLLSSPQHLSPPGTMPMPMPVPARLPYMRNLPKVDNPREIRNKAEKQRRDKLNQSIAELAAMVPPVVAASRKIDKTGVLRLTAHYLRAHQYVFGDSINQSAPEFTHSSTQALLRLFNGFLLTITYKGLIVVVSQNVNEYLGYTELELLGQNVFNITHEDDRQLLSDQLKPKSQMLGQNGELIVPEEQDGREKVAQSLANEKRRFVVRFKKLSQRSEPCKYVTCHVEGSLRKSDRACRGYNRCCQMVRRARARGDNPCSSGNDVVFIGVVRPTTDTFINESALESYKMEYRTRHSIDGEIIECEQRIALVTGYMTHEVSGVNAMNFIHRDEVRWVIIALREMYNQNQLFGESCYRLMTKNGQFIYMKTRGRLDVDQGSRAVTSFVCTNTVVEEDEGKHLINMMKERFTMQVNDNDDSRSIEDVQDNNDQSVPVEDPRQLEKVILNLVTNLPSPAAFVDIRCVSPDRGKSTRLSIIPPKRDRILSAIEKIYSIIKIIPKTPSVLDDEAPSFDAQMPPYKKDLQTQSSSETELNSELAYSPSSDYELSTGMGVNSYDTMSFDGDVESQTDVKFQIHSSEAGSGSNQLTSDPLMPGPSTAGIKRPNKFKELETTSKKKVMDAVIEQNSNEQSGRDSPTLETFFDEAILSTQIESAIDSLEETIDPSFPDLLISKEVQDILGRIEIEPNEKQPLGI